MLKTLTLIGMMFVGSLFAAAVVLPIDNDLDTQLQQASKRAINAATFQTMSAQSACAADDEARAALNISLTQRFEQMEKDLGTSSLLMLRTIETKDDALYACTYYKGAEATLSALIQRLTIQQFNEEASEAE